MKSITSGLLILTVSFFTLKSDKIVEIKEIKLDTINYNYSQDVIINKIDTIETTKQRIRTIQNKIENEKMD